MKDRALRCMLLDWFKAPGYVSVFVVNSRALVTQQAEYLKKHSLNQLAVGDLGPPHPDVRWLHSSTSVAAVVGATALAPCH